LPYLVNTFVKLLFVFVVAFLSSKISLKDCFINFVIYIYFSKSLEAKLFSTKGVFGRGENYFPKK